MYSVIVAGTINGTRLKFKVHVKKRVSNISSSFMTK